MLNEVNINESFPYPNTFNVTSKVVQSHMKSSDSGLWENDEEGWPLCDHSLALVMKTEWRRIFMSRFRSRWVTSNHRTDSSLTNVRYNLLNPIIRFWFEVNVHTTEKDKLHLLGISHMIKILGEFIRYVLINIPSTSHGSIPLILICYAPSK